MISLDFLSPICKNIDQLSSHEKYVVKRVFEAIEDSRSVDCKTLEEFRKFDNSRLADVEQTRRCKDLISAVIDTAWKDAMSLSMSQTAQDARDWWLDPDNETRIWMLDLLELGALADKLYSRVKEHKEHVEYVNAIAYAKKKVMIEKGNKRLAKELLGV